MDSAKNTNDIKVTPHKSIYIGLKAWVFSLMLGRKCVYIE